MRKATRERLFAGARNDRWLDLWSAGHLLLGTALGWVMDPFVAFVLLVLWEPFEILLLGPVVWRLTGYPFGHESWKNAMSDVLIDAAGVALGAAALRRLWDPPFVWASGWAG